jgi:hypothetical protein
VNLVRASAWILPTRIHLSIKAHNEFEMSDLFIRINLYSIP